ncbi:DUF4276 family protein [Candidatus Poribacteria bacterium]|nr:DUF4276 family protein [Candidatus Poribacteria bacterium]
MHIEIFVEEPSAEAALQNLVPKILGIFAQSVTFQIYPHQGKSDLLARLPARLKGYRGWIPSDWRIVVVVDADDEDCQELKAQLERIARDAGLLTKTQVGKGRTFQTLNRIAIEELEAWFFGDVLALHAVYPRVLLNLEKQAKYRNPDAIRGGTWEALEKVLQRYGYQRGGLEKIVNARNVSASMEPERNRSHSFQVFRDGLLELIR